MQAYKKTLSEILSTDVRLVAPLFQRPYVWNQEENWEPLWQAMLEVVQRRIDAKEPRPYFLGAVVLGSIRGSTGSVPFFEIIDGQQRMTTIQIMMETAKKILEDNDFDHAAKLLVKLTRNDIEVESDEQFKVWPTNLDRDAFRKVMTHQSASGLMQLAAEFFDKEFRRWLRADEDGAKDRAAAFVAAVKNDMVFVAIDLDNDDDGQLIFETLNALGTPLLPSDLVKNLLFREATTDKSLDTEILYDMHWKHFEEDSAYWRAPMKVGRRERPRLDVFLQFYLTFKHSKEPFLAHQFRDYRDSFRDGLFGSTAQALEDFARHARWYREFDQAKHGSAAGSLRHVLEVIDTSVLNPLVLGIYANVEPGDERDRMLAVVESYVMRRLLCGLTTKNLNKVTADLIGALKRNGWTEGALRDQLLGLSGNSTVWPDDEFVLWRSVNRSAYGDIRSVCLGLALSYVEAGTRTGKSETAWNTRRPMTIEHLLPQKWETNWPLPEGPVEETTIARNDQLHRIGNLTILTEKLNAAISNSCWETKRRHLTENTVLLMNSALAARETWTEGDIEARSLHLAQRFCDIWPRR